MAATYYMPFDHDNTDWSKLIAVEADADDLLTGFNVASVAQGGDYFGGNQVTGVTRAVKHCSQVLKDMSCGRIKDAEELCEGIPNFLEQLLL